MSVFTQSSLDLLVLKETDTYELIDSGHGRKLERFGKVTVDRPEPQALWAPKCDKKLWDKAQGVFTGDDDADQGRWRLKDGQEEEWAVPVLDATVLCRFTPFRHMGIFPEQLPHWQWMQRALKSQAKKEKPRLLNLFAYTGTASMLAAKAGADVTHVDASKKAIAWAKQNQAASKLQDAPIRWITEDARKFVQREIRRGKLYDGILVDPPKFGRGPEGEVWDFFTDIPAFLADCAKLVEPQTGFILLTSYAIRASATAIGGLMREIFSAGKIETGELAVQETGGGRILSAANYTRWQGEKLKVAHE